MQKRVGVRWLISVNSSPCLLDRLYVQLKWAVALSLLLHSGLSFSDSFEQYSVAPIDNLLVAPLNFTEVLHLKPFQARLSYIEGQSPNFAGRFYLTTIGCGTACQMVILIDATSGMVSAPITASAGICFTNDSQLLIVNPFIANEYDRPIPAWAYTIYYRLVDNQLERLESTKRPFSGDCGFE